MVLYQVRKHAMYLFDHGILTSSLDIKNPISLAKLILETSSKTLTLRRVPPNFLVGEGAKLFAMEHGMRTVSNEHLISRNASDRYQKWHADLQRARGEIRTASSPPSPPEITQGIKSKEDCDQEQVTRQTKARKGLLRDHTSAILTGMWNEGQPDSPSGEPASPTTPNSNGSNPATPSKTRSPLSGLSNSTQPAGTGISSLGADSSSLAAPASSVGTLTAERSQLAQSEPARPRVAGVAEDVVSLDRTVGGDRFMDSDATTERHLPQDGAAKPAVTELTAEPNDTDFDLITDTMGAIAIDSEGNIAAGSSSGGIGMKHMGRTGPAALVGIGTSVIPYFDEEHPEARTVAAVTSGTGEHMAATMAAQKCAERLYQGTRKGRAGRDVSEDDSAAIMKSFVLDDFMGHPGVRSQASARAIGVMAVEMTKKGIYLHWAHNTDSFALASMASHERAPATVMSRLPEGAGVNIGARKVFDHSW